MTTKACSKCGKEKDLEQFSRHQKGRFGRNSACKQCKNDQAKSFYQENSETILFRKKKYKDHRGRKFGLGKEDFDKMVASQDSKCAICHQELPLCIDHDHSSGVIRGLLCHRCNVGIGFFQDDVDLMASAIRYLNGPDC